MTITERQIHAPLFCVYDRDGDLIGAFPTLAGAESFRDHIAYGDEA